MARGRGGSKRGRMRRRAAVARRLRRSEQRSMKQGWNPKKSGRTDFRSYSDTAERKQLRREVREWQNMSKSQRSRALRSRMGGRGGGGGGRGRFEDDSQYLDEAAQAGYDAAIEQCGNAGQVSIIEAMGTEPWRDGLQGDGYDAVLEACSHPEAVDKVILPRSWTIATRVYAQYFDSSTHAF